MSPVKYLTVCASLQQATGSDAVEANSESRSRFLRVRARKARCCGVLSRSYREDNFTCLHTHLPRVQNVRRPSTFCFSLCYSPLTEPPDLTSNFLPTHPPPTNIPSTEIPSACRARDRLSGTSSQHGSALLQLFTQAAPRFVVNYPDTSHKLTYFSRSTSRRPPPATAPPMTPWRTRCARSRSSLRRSSQRSTPELVVRSSPLDARQPRLPRR